MSTIEKFMEPGSIELLEKDILSEIKGGGDPPLWDWDDEEDDD